MRLKTGSAAKTRMVAALMARALDERSPHPLILALSGDLGSGKTTFIQGFARALGIKRRLLSPTFLLMRSYKLPRERRGYRTLHHLDAYRLRRASETAALKLDEVLHNPQNVVLIEWAENVGEALPKNAVKMKFDHGKNAEERTISINA